MKKYITEPYLGHPQVLAQLEKSKKMKPSIHRAKWVGESTEAIKYGTLGYYYEDDGKDIFRPDGGPCGYKINKLDVWIL